MAVIAVVSIGLVVIFWPIIKHGPAGPDVPPFRKEAALRLHNASGLSIILPERWKCLQNNEIGIHLCPMTPLASRSRATMSLARLDAEPDLTGFSKVSFGDSDAWEDMRIVRKYSVDDVTGYHTGIQVNEHTDGDNIVVASNINGLEFIQAHHASRFARVGTYRNTHQVTVSGRHGFSIEQMNTEMPGVGQTDAANAWQTLVSDIQDPKNLGVGDINYWVVLGGTGAVDQFIKNGGASIRARRIGSAPPGK